MADLPPFTPVIDSVAQSLGMIPALVYGVAWRYCQMDGHVCRASHETMAKHIGVSRFTIMRHLETLTTAGYLEDLTPDAKGKAHIYRDTGKAFEPVVESNNIEQPVADSNIACDSEQQEVLQKATTPVAESHTKIQETLYETNDTNGASAPDAPIPKTPKGLTVGQKRFLELFGAKRFKNNTQKDKVLELERQYGTKRLLELGHWAALQGMSVGRAIVSSETALKKQAGNASPKVIRVPLT